MQISAKKTCTHLTGLSGKVGTCLFFSAASFLWHNRTGMPRFYRHFRQSYRFFSPRKGFLFSLYFL